MIQVLLERLKLIDKKEEDCDDEDKESFNDAIYQAKLAVARAERDQWRNLMVPREQRRDP